MTTNPNEIPELVTLHHILEENGFSVEAREAEKARMHYVMEYKYSCFSKNGALGHAFQSAAERLVPQSEGKVTMWGMGGGFVALFPTEENRLDFLKAFSKAASELYTPSRHDIQQTRKGFVLGATKSSGAY